MCPPGVDQTMRGSQHWRLVAPELLQHCDIQSNEETWSLDLRVKLLNPKVSWDAWGTLARPAISAPPNFGMLPPSAQSKRRLNGRSSKKRRVEKTARITKTLSALESLSNELLDTIIEQLDGEKLDMISFGLSSQRLWQLVLRHIHAGYLKCAEPWAGKRIAFQGSYSTDLPEGFTENGLAESITGTNWFGNMCAARRFFWQHGLVPTTPQCEESGWIEAARKHYDDSMGHGWNWSAIEAQLGCSYLFPKTQNWLLRNLTTRETVSTQRLSILSARNAKRGNVHLLEFDDVLLMRTCWTSIPSRGEDELNVHRGVWAGQRFDIVTEKAHDAEANVEDWCDVTEVVVKEAEILRGKIGQRDGAEC
jgi:hypothetical protein